MQRINQSSSSVPSEKLIQTSKALEAYNPVLANKFAQVIETDMQKATALSHIFIKMIRANHLPEFLFDIFCLNQGDANIILRGYAALMFEGYPSAPFSEIRKNLNDDIIHEYDVLVCQNFALAVQISPALEVLLGGTPTWELDKVYLNLLCQHPQKATNIARGFHFFGTTGVASFGCQEVIQQSTIVEFIIKNSENIFDVINFYKQIRKSDLPRVLEKDSIITNAFLGFQQLGAEFLRQIKSGEINLATLRKIITTCSNSNESIGYYFINSIIYSVKDLYDETSDEYIEHYANKLFESLDDTKDTILILQRVDLALHILCSQEQSAEVKGKIDQLNNLALIVSKEIGFTKIDGNSLLARRKNFITNSKFQSMLSLFSQEICGAPHQNEQDWNTINTDSTNCKEFQPAGPGYGF
ncbi:MAG: hypothetical protein KIT56_06930 [Gammaproteobacteria bacterium]|nr:hypothetical protein [Gammaproteobacteria bacterium]MCW5583599.1 hypothetical protein [Gammaproteobacteria bacterium]